MKSGRQVIATPLTGAKLANSPINSDSSTNQGLAGRRISSGDAGPNDPTWGRTLTTRPLHMRVGVTGADRRSSAPPPRASALFQRIGIAGLLGPRGQCCRLREHEQEFAVVDARQRPAEDAREHLAGIALDVDDPRDGQSRRIRAVEPGRDDLRRADPPTAR